MKLVKLSIELLELRKKLWYNNSNAFALLPMAKSNGENNPFVSAHSDRAACFENHCRKYGMQRKGVYLETVFRYEPQKYRAGRPRRVGKDFPCRSNAFFVQGERSSG